MKKQTKIFTVAIVAICLLTATVFAEAPTTTGTISRVTVYRGQALVTRTINVDLPPDTSELIVTNLPNNIIPESLYAQTSGDIKVMSVRYREKAVKEDTREEVKKLNEQIEEVTKQIQHAEGDLKHLHAQWDNMFSKLRGFTVDAAKSDLSRGLLTFEPIKKLTTFIEEKGYDYHKRATELRDKIAELKKELELLNRKLEQLNAGRSRTERQAILFVKKSDKKKSSIELSYLVNGANWLPQYNLRANPENSNALIEYNAVVNQTSGENWDAITLSLSTAEPAMVAAAPVLEPMNIKLTSRHSDRQIQLLMGGADSLSNTPQQVEERQSGFRDRSEDFKSLLKARNENSRKSPINT